MATRDDGGNAFPISIPGVGDNGAGGMSLRDWLAGQALAGILANPDVSASAARCNVSTTEFRVHIPAAAYAMADAMLAARKTEGAA